MIGTDGNNCSNEDSVYIHVKPLPTFSLGSDTSICEGDTITLSQPYSGASVLWSTNAITDTINVYLANQYTCEVTLDGCTYSDTISVSVDSLPVANFSYTISNSVITITDISKFGQNIVYYFGDGDSSLQANPTHTYSTNGAYTIKMLVSNSCGTDTLEKTLRIITGLNENVKQPTLLVYSNPVGSILNIDLLDLPKKNLQINLVDLKGAVLYKHFYSESDQLIKLDVSAFSSGIYILRIRQDNREFVNIISIMR